MHTKTKAVKVRLLQAIFQHRDRDKAVTPQVLAAIFAHIEQEFDIVHQRLDELESQINVKSNTKSKANAVQR